MDEGKYACAGGEQRGTWAKHGRTRTRRFLYFDIAPRPKPAVDPMVGHMDQLKTGLHAFLTSYTDKYGVFPSHPTHKHSQSARDSRTLAPQSNHFSCRRGTRRHFRSRP